MKQIYIIIILSFFTISINSCRSKIKEDIIKNEWISTYSGPFGSEGGIYLKYSDDSLYTTEAFDFNNLKKYKYSIDKSENIILNDTFNFGKIINTDKILQIKFKDEINKFIPIKDYRIKTDTSILINLLVNNDWYFMDWNFDKTLIPLRIDFDTRPWFTNLKKSKLLLKINETKSKESIVSEWWIIKKHNNSYFLNISTGQFDYQVYQIKNISDTLITTETCWFDSIEEIKFKNENKLSKEAFINIRTNIIGEWQLISYNAPNDSSEEFRISMEDDFSHHRRPYDKRDSVSMLSDEYYYSKTINYEFLSSGKCHIKSKNKILRSANWELSKDGKYIKTSEGWIRMMKIISISDSMLVFEKHENIEHNTGKYFCVEKYNREELKKVK